MAVPNRGKVVSVTDRAAVQPSRTTWPHQLIGLASGWWDGSEPMILASRRDDEVVLAVSVAYQDRLTPRPWVTVETALRKAAEEIGDSAFRALAVASWNEPGRSLSSLAQGYRGSWPEWSDHTGAVSDRRVIPLDGTALLFDVLGYREGGADGSWAARAWLSNDIAVTVAGEGKALAGIALETLPWP